ncbi:hypothetical protein [Pseudomonas cremoricolorata]|uniref:hypothetical protein n=1 Tax=Pseudomonas cremoricolorata TaxID=157783 RepID=UPI0006764335|nr:hypothetical protein [Pseudomonas cremoricolorata]
MKKLVPDPPRKLIHTPYLSIHSDLSPEDALAYAAQLLRSIEDVLDEYCLASAGAPGVGMLIGAAHAARTGQALLGHALQPPTPVIPALQTTP